MDLQRVSVKNMTSYSFTDLCTSFISKHRCDWCHITLKLTDYLEKAVCSDCYRKLISAGLSEKEIFNSDTQIAGIVWKSKV